MAVKFSRTVRLSLPLVSFLTNSSFVSDPRRVLVSFFLSFRYLQPRTNLKHTYLHNPLPPSLTSLEQVRIRDSLEAQGPILRLEHDTLAAAAVDALAVGAGQQVSDGGADVAQREIAVHGDVAHAQGGSQGLDGPRGQGPLGVDVVGTIDVQVVVAGREALEVGLDGAAAPLALKG